MAGIDSTGNHARKWDLKDLERRLCHALGIARKAVQHLASKGYTDAEDSNNNLRPEKVITETALLLYACSTAAYLPEIEIRRKELAESLIPYGRSKNILMGMCLEPALAWEWAQAHVLLKQLGYEDSIFDAALEANSHSPVRGGRERTPYRMLEQEWIKDLWKGAPNGNGRRRTAAAMASALGQSIDLLNGTREDIYAFTHAVMYVTDFNVRPHRLPRPRSLILSEAEAALAFCLDEQDYDLGGEVLLAWPLTGKTWSPSAVFGFRVLASVEDKVGFLPAPGTRVERLAKLQGTDRTDYLLATAYHTAYVMGLLCAAALQPERTPPAKIATRNSVPGSGKAMLQFLESENRSAHWWEELDRLKDRERDAIAGLLMNIALRRRVKQRDFAGLHQVLTAGYKFGLTNHPAASQAAQLLERVAAVANNDRGVVAS